MRRPAQKSAHLPFQRRRRALARFRRRGLQKFAAAHAFAHSRFNPDRSIERRAGFKDLRGAALAEWRQLLAACAGAAQVWRPGAAV